MPPCEARFGAAAPAYRTYRPAYPLRLFERILERVPPENRSCAMDLGAGTGLSTLPLCQWFAEVIAVEPDPRMAGKLEGLGRNIVVHISTAEECVKEPDSVDLVSCGTAFNWMDGPRVLRKASSWLRPHGVLAVFRYRFPYPPEAIRVILRKEFELRWDPFQHDRLRDEAYSRRTISAATGFADLETLTLHHRLHFQPRQLAGFCASTSYGTAYLRTLADPQAYLKELETRFRQAHPAGMIPVDSELELVLAGKSP
jgi:SAM-dependent methyltransferase